MLDDDTLKKLAEENGTPLYVYDGDAIIENYVSFRDAFIKSYPDSRVLYAVKANSSLAILRLLARAGAGADVVSGGELFLALKAGIKASDIVYTSSSKTFKELEYALSCGVTVTHGNVEELEFYAGMAAENEKTARVSVRVNPDVSPKTHPKIATGLRNTKFGLHIEGGLAFKAYTAVVESENLSPVGLHCHIGSQITESAAFMEATVKLLDFAARLENELGIRLEFIDVGGGLGISYDGSEVLNPQGLAEAVVPVFEEGLNNLSYRPSLYLEPGRFIVGPAGTLLLGVNSVKKTPYKNFVNVDGGFNTLARPAMYGSFHRMRVLGKNGSEETFDVAGNVCESGDILGRDKSLAGVSRGDVIAVSDAGAYCFSMASEYNSYPLPAEVLVRGGRADLIRRRRVYGDLLNNQLLPEDLK